MHKEAWLLIGFVTGAVGRCRETKAAPAESSRCQSAVQTAPFASFSGRTEKEGPARPERGPISSFLVKANKKGRGNAEILRNGSFERSPSYYFHCAAGFADATSFSLLDAKRTKQEKHAWGNVPHAPRARHFGSRQSRGTLEPVRRKGFKLTASRRFRQEAFSFPRCAGESPHEPRPQFGAMLPWPSISIYADESKA